MLSDRCLSVWDVGVLLPNGWIDQDDTSYAGRPRPCHVVLDGDPAYPHFSAHVYWSDPATAEFLYTASYISINGFRVLAALLHGM